MSSAAKITDKEFEQLKCLPQLQISCLYAAYLLCGLKPPRNDVLLQQHKRLMLNDSPQKELPAQVIKLYHALEPTSEMVLHDISTTDLPKLNAPNSVQALKTFLNPPENILPTISCSDLLTFCEKEGVTIPDSFRTRAKAAASYKERFQSSILYRINAIIAYYTSKNVVMPKRVFSEELWGLGAACHIVSGSAVPSKHDNNKELQLEKDAYDYCVANNFRASESSVNPISIADLYNYARAAILNNSLRVMPS